MIQLWLSCVRSPTGITHLICDHCKWLISKDREWPTQPLLDLLVRNFLRDPTNPLPLSQISPKSAGGMGTVDKNTTTSTNGKTVTFSCGGMGITNNFKKNLTISGFPCLVTNAGKTYSTNSTSASLDFLGNEKLNCTITI